MIGLFYARSDWFDSMAEREPLLSAVQNPPAVLIPIDSQSDGSWPTTQQQPAHDLIWTIQGVGSDQE